MKGIVSIIERDNDNIWCNLPNIIRKNMLRYKGFDGLHMKDYEYSSNVLEILILEQKKREKIQDLIIISVANNVIDNLSSDFRFIGYDVGVIEEFEEFIFFSGILNELRKEGNKHFGELWSKLNSYYLFESIVDCKQYLILREEALKSQEKNFIETAYSSNQFEICSIFLYT